MVLAIIENPDTVDWARLYDLIRRSYSYMDNRIDPPSSFHRMSIADFEQKAADETLILAEDGVDMVGCLFCRDEGDSLYVGKVAVAEEQQGRGIGRALFDRAFVIAQRRGASALELETRIELTENHRAFERLGFSKVSENAHEGFNRPTSIRMRRRVSR